MLPSELVDQLSVRASLERYMACVDQKDWDGVAACFADDAESVYNNDPTILRGGAEVADFIQRAIAAYESTVHDLANCLIQVDGDVAHAQSRAIIGILKTEDGTVSIRAIGYRDELRRTPSSWVVVRRTHEPLWQYDVPGTTPNLIMR